jgi:thiamine biosynthesis lipoprotein ApbE
VIRETVEAIVVADRASIADAWSTGLLVIGANRNAGRLIDRAGIEARVADSSGRYVTSEGWEAFVARGPRAQIRSAD